mgnify:FL=1
MKKLNKNNFSSWKEYYFEYQKSLAEHYYIPFFQKNKIELENKHILEIGCGNGGFINAFGRFSDNCVGFDLKNLQWKKTNVKYHKLDVFDDELINKIDSKFDIIILRDVVEHLDNSQTNKLFNQIQKLSNSNTVVLITFPPFYSPFGLHQQVLLESILRFIPYLSSIPKSLIKVLIENDKNKDGIAELLSLYESKKTISMFYKLLSQNYYNILDEEFFYVRPSHEIRYGIKTIKSRLIQHIPLLREIFITGTIFLIKRY